MYSPAAKLSQNYILEDLTKTNQSLKYPNEPEAAWQFQNLEVLAQVLEQMEFEIGPFNIISGYRTKELQQKLASSGEPTGSGTMSFHEAGRAVDIFPTTMSIDDYFGRILASPTLFDLFSEIAIKPTQNALHLAVNVPGDIRKPKVTGLTSGGVYAKLSLEEITNYIKPFVESLDYASDLAMARLVSIPKAPLIIGIVAAVGGVLFILLSKSGQSRRAL